MKYPIGTKYSRTVAKGVKRTCTVIDYHVTRNLAGEIVKERYVTVNDIGTIDYDASSTEVSKGLLPEYQHLL